MAVSHFRKKFDWKILSMEQIGLAVKIGPFAYSFLKQATSTDVYMDPRWPCEERRVVFTARERRWYTRVFQYVPTYAEVEYTDDPRCFQIIEVICDDSSVYRHLLNHFHQRKKINQSDIIEYLKLSHMAHEGMKHSLQPFLLGRYARTHGGFPVDPDQAAASDGEIITIRWSTWKLVYTISSELFSRQRKTSDRSSPPLGFNSDICSFRSRKRPSRPTSVLQNKYTWVKRIQRACISFFSKYYVWVASLVLLIACFSIYILKN